MQPETTTVPQVVQIEPDQLALLGQMLSFNAGLLAFLILLVGGLLIIEIHRG